MKRYSKEERALAIELWEESGLSRSKFCEREGIAKTTFQEWVKRYGNIDSINSSLRKSEYSEEGFLSVKVSSSSSSVGDTDTPLTIHYPNGVKLTGLKGLSSGELLSLIVMD